MKNGTSKRAQHGAEAADGVDERKGRAEDEQVGQDLNQLHVRERHAPGELVWDRGIRGAQLDELVLQRHLQRDRRSAYPHRTAVTSVFCSAVCSAISEVPCSRETDTPSRPSPTDESNRLESHSRTALCLREIEGD